MEPMTRRRLLQKAKNIYYSLRNLLCFFAPVDTSEQQQTELPVTDSRNFSPADSPADNSYFGFNSLPEDCQRQVFQHLSVLECGRASVVCRQWHHILQSSAFWSNVDLTAFAVNCEHAASTGHCNEPACYDTYKRRVQKYVAHLNRIQPSLRRLSFAFDIGDGHDDWLELLHELLSCVRCCSLRSACLNWKETPAKSACLSCSPTLTHSNLSDLMSLHRRRQRLFTGFLEFFAMRASNIVLLKMPFDWSARSVQALCQLTSLETLTLETYYVCQPVDQAAIDTLLSGLCHLRCLSVAVCVSSGPGLVTFSIHSHSLQHLDVSQCNGFYFCDVLLPNLLSLDTALRPHHGPLIHDAGSPVDRRFACILILLRRGAPRLQQLNKLELPSGWRTESDCQLSDMLCHICACPSHYHCLDEPQ